jgi:hypothetical protein
MDYKNVFYSKKGIKSLVIVLLPSIFFIGVLGFLFYLKTKGHDTRIASFFSIVISSFAFVVALVVFFGLNYRINKYHIEIRVLSDSFLKIPINEITKVQETRKTFNVLGFSSKCIQIKTKNKTYQISPSNSQKFVEEVHQLLSIIKKIEN